VTTILGSFWRGIGVLSLDKKLKSKKKYLKVKNLRKRKPLNTTNLNFQLDVAS
jgi:hypothetical protein